jgi:hypothetical protein
VQQRAFLAKSPIGKATGYALNQWAALNRHLDDGNLAMNSNRGSAGAPAGRVDPGASCEGGCAPVWWLLQ